jgi:hypothetical protein
VGFVWDIGYVFLDLSCPKLSRSLRLFLLETATKCGQHQIVGCRILVLSQILVLSGPDFSAIRVSILALTRTGESPSFHSV